MSAFRTSPRVSRSPNGCDGKPILVAVSRQERAEFEGIAGKEVRSLSATLRLLALKGLEAYRKEQASPGT